MKDALGSIDPKLPVEEIALVSDIYARMFARERFMLALMGGFAAVALALTAAGIFAVLSQVVAQRTREIGIRVALGASPADVFSLVLSRGMALTAVGVVVGLAGAFALTRFLRGLMYEVSPYDAGSFAGVTALLAVVAFLACWIPTRAAMRVQPAVALRVE